MFGYILTLYSHSMIGAGSKNKLRFVAIAAVDLLKVNVHF